MEVYIRSLDSRWTKEQLQEAITTILRQFDVTVFEIRKPANKTFAFLTIADAPKAQKFLASAATNTTILHSPSGRPAVFQLSNKPPLEDTLRRLRAQEKDAQTRLHARPLTHRKPGDERTKARDAIAFSSLECGAWEGKIFVPFFAWPVSGTLRHDSRDLIIKIQSSPAFEAVADRFQIDSLAVSSVGNLRSVLITFAMAPKIFERPSAGSDVDVNTMFSLLGLGNRRQVSFRDTSLPTLTQAIVGACLVYRLTLRPDLRKGSLRNRLVSLASYQLSVTRVAETASRPQPLNFHDYVNRINTTLQSAKISFAIRFQIQALWANGFMSPRQVLALLPVILQKVNETPEGRLVALLGRLALRLRYANIHSTKATDAVAIIERETSAILSDDRHLLNTSKGRDEVSIHRVLITPTGTYLEGPEEVVANRVLRKHRAHCDCFLRVTFADEDESRLEFNRDISNERILRGRFLQILDGGLSIAGEQFDFLGFSHSSLRSQSCWFMRPFTYEGSLLYASSLIKQLGDFSGIRCPAKCAARIGQAFSETHSAITVDPSIVEERKDIICNRRLFTDGCGTMSPDVWKLLKKATPFQQQPTVYQIRFKGAKGVISLDTRLQGKQLRLRESMVKFKESPSNDIEICGTNARALPFKFNRSLIKILEDLGVPAIVFENLQAAAIDDLRRSASSVTSAIEFLQEQLSESSSGLTSLLKVLNQMDIDVAEDSFLREVLSALLQLQLREIKYRSRIPVPQALTLYGICDETEYLGEGEIYVTFAGRPSEGQSYITGRVAITRSPALHPGDVQVVTAVSPPAGSCLWDLTNCVVFSAKGQRDLPSMLSGGDLDGDLYNVIYDQDLLPHYTDTPADYQPVQPVDIGREVTPNDMTQFFVDFMQNDQLGRIATLHMVFADLLEGTRGSDCLQLAELHSTAVDFSKSGIKVNIQKFPRAPAIRPDFMAPNPGTPIEKGIPKPNAAEALNNSSGARRFQYYESNRVLGRLFRAVDEESFFANLSDDTSSLFSDDASDDVLSKVWDLVETSSQIQGWKKHTDLAKQVRDYYEGNLLDIMSKYAMARSPALTEKEVFIGRIVGISGSRNKLQREQSDLLKTRFNRDLRDIRAWMEDKVEQDWSEFLCLAAACLYIAVKQPSNAALGEDSTPLRSFAWYAAGLCVPELVGDDADDL